jgi:hypothetical protein
MITRANAIGSVSTLALSAVAMGCGDNGSAYESATSALAGQVEVAFQANTNFLWRDPSGPGTASNTGFAMQSGTIPSQITHPNVASIDWMGWHGSNGHFWVEQTSGFPVDSNGLMQNGTSPTITYESNDGSVIGFGFHGANGNLWMGLNGPFSGVDTHGLMQSGTSPSVVVLFNNQTAMAFHGGNGNLWIGLTGPFSGVDTHGLMAGGTNPIIGARGGGSGSNFAFAFQGSNGHLWFGEDDVFAGFDTQLGMKAGTSPSVAFACDQITEYVAFQANTGFLWLYTYSSDQVGTATIFNYAMASKASPTIFLTPDCRYQIAFKGSNGHLWILLSGQAAEDQGYAMN